MLPPGGPAALGDDLFAIDLPEDYVSLRQGDFYPVASSGLPHLWCWQPAAHNLAPCHLSNLQDAAGPSHTRGTRSRGRSLAREEAAGKLMTWEG